MWVVDEGVEQGFADIYSLMKECKFANCTHQKEPGCAIRTALSEGTLTQSRWRNYEKIQKESNFQKKKERISKLMEKKNSIKKEAKPRMKKLFFLEEE
jgi:ribosome biogenesis GTPase / thiamine phosphate phosphatase